MARIYLGLGSNIDPENNLGLGIRELRRRYGNIDVSGVYKSAALGFDGPDFLNLVVGLDTEAGPDEVHKHIEAIHNMVGRHRGEEKFASRPLDIDVLLYDDLIIDDYPLRLPRSDILEYGFVLRPLAELAPELLHPETGLTMAEHWRAFDHSRHPLTPVQIAL
ncbi:MAG: 2-amino-4-hydroxy-6-hydroxymethyldihydropteridine diphosphokinase [Woeseiaceae bacterium]|nr:2-amino-4-hydroxy-6-hydroxymethyldihydropteridine diphosphokinase [Woeseiaceae bacterium]